MGQHQEFANNLVLLEMTITLYHLIDPEQNLCDKCQYSTPVIYVKLVPFKKKKLALLSSWIFFVAMFLLRIYTSLLLLLLFSCHINLTFLFLQW